MASGVVLVTGGSGCLGQHIIKHLHLLGTDVKEIRILDVVKYEQKLDFEISKPMKTFVGSITDQSVVNEACDGVDVVLHIASLIDWRLFPNQKTLHEVNVTGTETILKACKDKNVPYLIYCSSLSIFYGPQEIKAGTETSVQPQTNLYFGAYAKSKSKAQKMVLGANGSKLKNGKSLRTLAILPLPLYGELDYHNITPSVQPFKDKTYTLIGPMTARVHYSYAGNCAYMFIKAMEAIQRNPEVGGEYFFAADDTPPNIFPETIRPFFEQFNVKTSSWHVPYWLIMSFVFIVYCVFYVIRFFTPVDLVNLGFTTGSISFLNTTCYVTYDKANTLLGYKPLYDYKTSIEMSKKFYAKVV
ncbi:unnamed protein product [Mytilus edulis]|uniref:3-beta hydroxysteroid dehydrogenase/isomerase domain-containing protein n=1 Tax=Mytilus edulis TaxID=6550 RepID=A0A8S3QGR6_MYTED|nr:unnamed protein product [Mytilus edulis]